MLCQVADVPQPSSSQRSLMQVGQQQEFPGKINLERPEICFNLLTH